MDTIKQKIKSWLKERSITRDVLAKRMGVTKRTIDRWLTANEVIPAMKLEVIEQIMQSENKHTSGLNTLANKKEREFLFEEIEPIAVTFSKEEYALISKVAKMQGMSAREFIELSVIEDAEYAASTLIKGAEGNKKLLFKTHDVRETSEDGESISTH